MTSRKISGGLQYYSSFWKSQYSHMRTFPFFRNSLGIYPSVWVIHFGLGQPVSSMITFPFAYEYFAPSRVRSISAILAYIPYTACLKYTHLGSSSTSTSISSTRGRGWSTFRLSLPSESFWASRTNTPF